MPRKRPEYNWDLIRRWIREGRGSGEGQYYIPWLKIQDFSSRGRCHRIPDWKNGRIHHLFSDFEERVFFLYCWSDKITDIREQYPLLPVEETMEIANRLSIRHPGNRKYSSPIVFTTDFLLTVPDLTGKRYIARTAKYSKDLSNPRTLAKLEIERHYWLSRNVDWGVVTELNLPKRAFHNIKLFYSYHSLNSLFPLKELDIKDVGRWLTKEILNSTEPLRNICRMSDAHFGLGSGKSINIALHLIARKFWEIDINKPFNPSQKLVLKNALMLELKLKQNTFYQLGQVSALGREERRNSYAKAGD